MDTTEGTRPTPALVTLEHTDGKRYVRDLPDTVYMVPPSPNLVDEDGEPDLSDPGIEFDTERGYAYVRAANIAGTAKYVRSEDDPFVWHRMVGLLSGECPVAMVDAAKFKEQEVALDAAAGTSGYAIAQLLQQARQKLVVPPRLTTPYTVSTTGTIHTSGTNGGHYGPPPTASPFAPNPQIWANSVTGHWDTTTINGLLGSVGSPGYQYGTPPMGGSGLDPQRLRWSSEYVPVGHQSYVTGDKLKHQYRSPTGALLMEYTVPLSGVNHAYQPAAGYSRADAVADETLRSFKSERPNWAPIEWQTVDSILTLLQDVSMTLNFLASHPDTKVANMRMNRRAPDYTALVQETPLDEELKHMGIVASALVGELVAIGASRREPGTLETSHTGSPSDEKDAPDEPSTAG